MVFKTWLSDINKVALAVDGLKKIRIAGTIKELNPDSLNAFVKGIDGLTLSQAQAALSTRALTNDQKNQILVTAGLLKTTESMTASELKQVVAENVLTDAKQQEVLATFEAEMAEGKMSLERLQAIALEDTEAGAIARVILAKKEENAQNLKNIASGKALATVLKEQLMALASNPMTWVVAGLAGVVTVAYQCSQAIEEVEAKAQELNETFSTSKTEIEDYKTQIDDLYKVINDSGSSIEDVTTARQNLMSIQDQLIEKFGDEKGAIDLITDAINGQTDALNILTEAQWQAAKNEFNESGFWNDVANGIDGYSNNIDRMLGEYEGYSVTIDMSEYGGTLFTEGYDKFKQMLMDDFGATISKSSTSALELSGSASEVRQKLLDIQEILKENSTYKPDDTFSDYLGGLERSANDVIEKYEDFYKQYVLYEEIFTNDTFTDSYKKINKAYSEYQDAFATGDKGSIKKAQDNFANILTQATEGVSDESVVDFFNDMYPDLQEVVGNWQFEMNFTANTDGLKDDVSGYLSGLDGLYSYDLKNFSYDTATEEQKASYDGLISVARLYGLTIDQLIDKLVLMGLVQDEEYQRLVDKFGKENIAKIAPEDLTFAYQIKNVGDMSFEEFQAEIQRLKDESQNPDKTDIFSGFLEEQTKAIDDFKSKAKTLGDTLTSLSNGENIDLTDLIKDFPELADETDNLDYAIRDLIKGNLDVLFEKLGKNLPDNLRNDLIRFTNELTGLTPKLSTSFSDVQKSYDALQNLRKEMESGRFTDSTLSSIAGINEKMNTLVAGFYAGGVSEEELFNALNNQYKLDEENYGKALIAKNKLNEQFYESVGMLNTDVTNKFNHDYGVDISNCKTYNAAKIKIENETLKKVSGAWAEYYNVQQVEYTKKFKELENAARSGDSYANYAIYQIKKEYEDYNKAMNGLNQIVYNGINSNFEDFSSSFDSNGKNKSVVSSLTDWIEVKISRIQRAITNMSKVISGTYRNWSTRNKEIAKEFGAINDEIATQTAAYNSYINEINTKIKFNDDEVRYKDLVINGSLSIEEIKDENLKQKIDDYKSLYEKALNASDAIEDLRSNLADLAKTKFENVSKQYDNQMLMIDHNIQMLQGFVEQSESAGYMASEVYYQAMAEKQQENIAELQDKYGSLLSAFDESVKNGSIEKYSEEWYNMLGDINDVEKELQSANTQLIEFNQTLQQLSWDVFDRVHDSISDINSEANFLIDIISRSDLFTDDGQITNEGLAVQGLYAVNYNTYMEQSLAYAEEIKRLNDEIAKDPYDLELIDRKNELIKAQQEAIANANSEKDAIRDLISNGYDKMLDSLDKLISKQKELLNSKKDLYDYENNITNQTKDIANLRKQLEAYKYDNSENAKATIQKLQVSLDEAEAELKETEYERYISDQEQLLDKLYSDTEQWINERLDDIDGLIIKAVDATNQNAEIISNTINNASNEYSVKLSEKMDAIWNSQENSINGINTVVSIYGDIAHDDITSVGSNIMSAITGGNTNVISAINNVQVYMNQMISELNAIATNNKNTIANVQNSVVNNQNPISSSTNTQIPTSKPTSTNNNTSSNSTPVSNNNASTNATLAAKKAMEIAALTGQITAQESKIAKLEKQLKNAQDSYKYNMDGYNKNPRYNGEYYSKALSYQKEAEKIDAQLVNERKYLQALNAKKDFYSYKSGSRNISKNQLAWTQDGGSELIYRAVDGAILTPLNMGDKVFTHQMSENLWNLAQIPKLPSSKPNNANIKNDIQLNIGVKADNYDEFVDSFKLALKNDSQCRKLVQCISVDELVGKGGLLRNKY